MQLNRVLRMMSSITEWDVGPDLASGPQFTRMSVRRQAATLRIDVGPALVAGPVFNWTMVRRRAPRTPRHARGLELVETARGLEPACGELVESVETAATLHPTTSFPMSSRTSVLRWSRGVPDGGLPSGRRRRAPWSWRKRPWASLLPGRHGPGCPVSAGKPGGLAGSLRFAPTRSVSFPADWSPPAIPAFRGTAAWSISPGRVRKERTGKSTRSMRAAAGPSA